MRDTTSWRQSLTKQLSEYWPSTENLNIARFCDIELGLYLLSQLAPDTSAHSLWVLLTGYPFPLPEAENWSPEQQRMLGNARHILTQFRSKYRWEQALKRYRLVSEAIRGYDIDEKLDRFSACEVSVCSKRQQVYDEALKKSLPHRKDSIKWATAGKYYCSDGKYRATLEIPDELIFSPPSSHDLTGKTKKAAIAVTWKELIETARWMDLHADARWEERLNRVSLELFDRNGTLTLVEKLSWDGLMHLIGMVSSGKSTLMDILAVWAARQDLHITIVVGDVIGALNRAKLFARLGISVAPILGSSNRVRHTNRLHRALATEQPLTPLEQEHIGFRWLSTACPLSEMRRDVSKPFAQGKQPCRNLFSISENEEENQSNTPKAYACPIYSHCPFHQAQKDLVHAKIWIATPASLVYTRVAPQINGDRIRFSELVYRHSDLVIVDEADQVQVQLDSIFSPSQKLFGPGGDGWLSQVQEVVVQQLNQTGRRQLADLDVEKWRQAHDMAQSVTSAIYALFQSETTETKPLSKWVKQGEYFTDWQILENVALILSGASPKNKYQNQAYRHLMELFEDYLNDPLGNNRDRPLSELTRKVINITNEDVVFQHLERWINQHKETSVSFTDEELKKIGVQLQLGLLVTVLQKQIHQMLQDWKSVEEPLKLAAQSSMVFHSPPRDYEAIIPASPMGNVLAFQYILAGDNKSGTLRFFKCMGVGRWLLINLHNLFSADGIVGPHVLLLSGTSWARKAPGYHVQVPVSGVLRSPDSELKAIEDSYFEFSPFSNEDGDPITVSGAGSGRNNALKEILNQLAQTGGLGGPSLLEAERDELPENRQRILLIVGSYEQAKLAQEHLETIQPNWRGQVLRLVRDDDELGRFDTQWSDNHQSLQRGLLHKFASTEAWILIAPLMAIERGHNILNEEDKAAIGAAYFLVRPHPRPDDISYAIHSINRWAIEHYPDHSWLEKNCPDGLLTLENMGKTFRNAAYKRWRYLLHLPMIYSTLPDNEREAVIWNQLVSIWQVIGRLIRGGSPARVFFCDAAFARRTAFQYQLEEEPLSSLLRGIQQVLSPYFMSNSNSQISPQERELVKALYGPFYTAIQNIGGMTNGL